MFLVKWWRRWRGRDEPETQADRQFTAWVATGEPIEVDEAGTVRLVVRDHVLRLLSATEPVTWLDVVEACDRLWTDAGVEGPYRRPNVPVVMVEQAALGDAETRRLRLAVQDAAAALSWASGRLGGGRDAETAAAAYRQARDAARHGI